MIELRELIEDDSSQLIVHLNNENVVRYLSSRIPSPYAAADAHWWIYEGSKAEIVRAITLNDNFVGVIGVRRDTLEKSHRGEIGYWIGQPYWGKGIATAAIEQMCNIIYRTTDIVQLYAPVFSPNEGSKKALIKNGFKLEGNITKGILKNGALYDECIFCKISS